MKADEAIGAERNRRLKENGQRRKGLEAGKLGSWEGEKVGG